MHSCVLAWEKGNWALVCMVGQGGRKSLEGSFLKQLSRDKQVQAQWHSVKAQPGGEWPPLPALSPQEKSCLAVILSVKLQISSRESSSRKLGNIPAGLYLLRFTLRQWCNPDNNN